MDYKSHKLIDDTGVMQMRFYLYLTNHNKEEEARTKQHYAYNDICTMFSIKSENVVIENISPEQPFNSRRLFKLLVSDKINPGDTLILLTLKSLGKNTNDIEDALFFCFLKEINIYCYHPKTKLEPTAECCMSFLITLQKKVDIHNLKATRSRSRVTKVKLGRKEGSKYRRDIFKLKNAGFTQFQTATKIGVSLSTVKRHWRSGIID